jgi:transcriptional regulator with XRE-family HTH domain
MINGVSSGRTVTVVRKPRIMRKTGQNRSGSPVVATAQHGQPEQMTPSQTALGRLLQDRREAVGYSRARVGELTGIKQGTIEGWELGRVVKPPIHDVLRLAHFLGVSAEEIQVAVFADSGGTPATAQPSGSTPRRKPDRRPAQGAVPLLEAAFRLFGWPDDSAAGEALGASAEQVRRWRSGAEEIELADYMTLTSMIGIAAAAALKGDEARIADLSAAAQALGLDPNATAR